ncbi:UDP-glycosyltransferase 73C2-like protein [Trifolium pratense]|uniref:UDP-glycosyltransferase 73C2-like protein n=1 Tax=Trifolium pratense TaxID=57577 RepID=A0A2K3MG76_TRIPR|nr:UDP-glycosyltransferase 73C2-like protein [Trifolium pratense]
MSLSMEFLASHSCAHITLVSPKFTKGPTQFHAPFVVRDFPDTIYKSAATYLPEAMKQDSKEQKKEAIDQFKVSKLSLQGTLVNTFEELEIYVRGYEKFAKKVWCIGPMTS